MTVKSVLTQPIPNLTESSFNFLKHSANWYFQCRRSDSKIQVRVAISTYQLPPKLCFLFSLYDHSNHKTPCRHACSLKESVYKAMHPILCHYVGFQEAEITPLSNGTAKVTLNLASGAHEKMGIVVQSASWKKIRGFFLTSASVGTKGKSI